MILDMDREKGMELFKAIDEVFERLKVVHPSERMILATLYAIEKQGFVTYEMVKYFSSKENELVEEKISMFG